MKKIYQLTEEEFKAIEQAIENTLGYCGSWNDTDIIEVKKETGHGVSMRVDAFLESLKSEFIIKK
jgi:hypothetical protein